MILTRKTIQQEEDQDSQLPPRSGHEHSQGFSQSCHDMSMLISDCNLYSLHRCAMQLTLCVHRFFSSSELAIFIVMRIEDVIAVAFYGQSGKKLCEKVFASETQPIILR